MNDLKRGMTVTSPLGRRFVVNSITVDGKVLLDRLDSQPGEHLQVWKNRVPVETWERLP
jgi:hypothetical protein